MNAQSARKPARKPVRKAVFPVAGLGTRFLPATKSMPKEMLPINDRPLIQHVFEEAREAGIEEFIFVTGRHKEMLEEHFDYQPELEQTLESRGKTDMLDKVRSSEIPAGQLFLTRQPKPLGLGHAVWCAAKLVGDEPFAVLLPDDIVKHEKGCLAQMIDTYNETGGNIVAIKDVPRAETNRSAPKAWSKNPTRKTPPQPSPSSAAISCNPKCLTISPPSKKAQAMKSNSPTRWPSSSAHNPFMVCVSKVIISIAVAV